MKFYEKRKQKLKTLVPCYAECVLPIQFVPGPFYNTFQRITNSCIVFNNIKYQLLVHGVDCDKFNYANGFILKPLIIHHIFHTVVLGGREGFGFDQNIILNTGLKLYRYMYNNYNNCFIFCTNGNPKYIIENNIFVFREPTNPFISPRPF